MERKLSWRKINVLAVDDIPANLVALEAVLGQDCNVTVASSGAEALSVLKNRDDIDVILLDLQMPDMDGYETAARIKRMERCFDIPIIFITAVYKEEPFVRKGYEAGAVDYFSKPFDPEILKMKVAMYGSFRQKADILKERERQIIDSEELLKAGHKLSSVLESLPVGVLISDNDGRICQTNAEVSRICGYMSSERRDAYGEILGWWDSSGKMLKQGPLTRALNEGTISYNEVLQIRTYDGSPKTLRSSASPLLGLDGEIVGAVVVIQDITEHKKIQEDLEKRVTKLVSLGVELEQMARH
jgi:PAS domain S-box-containing protein